MNVQNQKAQLINQKKNNKDLEKVGGQCGIEHKKLISGNA